MLNDRQILSILAAKIVGWPVFFFFLREKKNHLREKNRKKCPWKRKKCPWKKQITKKCAWKQKSARESSENFKKVRVKAKRCAWKKWKKCAWKRFFVREKKLQKRPKKRFTHTFCFHVGKKKTLVGGGVLPELEWELCFSKESKVVHVHATELKHNEGI